LAWIQRSAWKMSGKPIKIMIAAIVLLVFMPVWAQQEQSSNNSEHRTPQEVAHHFCELFHSNKLDELSPCFADKRYTLDSLRRFRTKVTSQLGSIGEALNERITIGRADRSLFYFESYHRFSAIDRPVQTILVFNSQNKIYRFSIQRSPLEAETDFADYQTKTALRLPFDGEWYVGWGGRSINLNNHTEMPDQRFAYDFNIQKNHSNYRSDGSRNEHYYCFGKPILAPGAGLICKVIDAVEDSPPEAPGHGAGNLIVIDHENGEFSFLCHLKRGSVGVREGDRVVLGQVLGLCGNSGHSTGPHLHYHLQDSDVLFNGHGLPAQFQSYYADEVWIERGEPIWDQHIRPRTAR